VWNICSAETENLMYVTSMLDVQHWRIEQTWLALSQFNVSSWCINAYLWHGTSSICELKQLTLELHVERGMREMIIEWVSGQV